ncbi:MAG TPA: ATP-binding cassette domain-containing protein, partial [Burkholderiaceae bacterium]|nr:ATP-binding cassette domain-containing protein [Burkholderiaceae bacterium]
RARTADLVAGQTELLMAGRLEAQRQAIAVADARIARTDDRLNRLETRAVFMQGAAGAVTLAAMVLAAGWLVDEVHMGAPVAALCILVALAAGEPFAALRRGALEAGRTALALRRLAPALGALHEEPSLAAPVNGDAVCIEVAEVRHPGASQAALPALSLHIGVGERVALVGPSGAGKSTLLALVAGEITAAQGRVKALPASWLTQRIDLFEDSLRDNLRIADPTADDGALHAALDDAGLGADVAALRAQLDTPLGEGGLGLSGGQARRLALARLFLHARPLWLLDEATEALDAATANDLLARLRVRAAGHTLLIATHLRREAALADRLLRIDHGRVVQDLRRGTAEFAAALSALRPD